MTSFKYDIMGLDVTSNEVLHTTSIENLGSQFENYLTFDDHVTLTVHAALFGLLHCVFQERSLYICIGEQSVSYCKIAFVECIF